MTATVAIKSLPTLMFVDDYHDIGITEWTFKEIGLKLNVREIGYDYYSAKVVGLVYTGRLPANAEINALLKKKHVQLIDPDYI